MKRDEAPVRVALIEADAARPAARLLAADPAIQVAASGTQAEAALALVRVHAPDVLVIQPGPQTPVAPAVYDAVRRVMAERPLPIVLSVPRADVERPRALAAGAVACVEWAAPAAVSAMSAASTGTGADETGEAMDSSEAASLRQAVRLMAEVKVVRRWSRGAAESPSPGHSEVRATGGDWASPLVAGSRRHTAGRGRARAAGPPLFVGIGASTGGPAALKTILCALQVDFALPVLVVQHIASGFLPGMAKWLGESCRLPVHVAQYGTQPLPGHVYLAPDGLQMGVDARNGRIVLAREASSTALCPSASYLFHSLAEGFGPRAIGVLLTGMGKDGAQGLKHMKECGAITIAQDKDSSVVHGMPGEAIALGAATHVLPAEAIAPMLTELAVAPKTSDKGGTT